MPITWGAYLAAACLLAVAGAPRVLRPDETVVAARQAGLPLVSAFTVRLMGAVEVALFLAVLVVPGPVPAVLIAATYVGFAAVTGLAVVRGADSCGCFAGEVSEPSWLHVGVNLVLAGSAAAVALAGGASVRELARVAPGEQALLQLLAAGLTAWLLYLVLARFPTVAAAREETA